jgi:hypothetical protein
MGVRQISEQEKGVVKKAQTGADGYLKCFITGEIIRVEDEVEYDHVTAYNYDGPSDIVNVRVVLKEFNRRKKEQSLFDVKNYIQLQKLFAKKQNNVKLQDILEYKGIIHKNFGIEVENSTVKIFDADDEYTFQFLHDDILDVNYYYGRLPLKWLQNDDQEGLQPRVIDQKRLFQLSKHLKKHPQLAPAIARLVDDKLLLFDGQHKTAAQALNNIKEIDCKVYISPNETFQKKKLFDALMITNLDAHSKLRQVAFYTSTLVERFSVIYKELWEEFTTTEQPSEHNEEKFFEFIIKKRKFDRAQANDIMKSAITESALTNSDLTPFIAEASKDQNYPITQEILKKGIFPYCLYIKPSKAQFDSLNDYRNTESSNFKEFVKILIKCSHLDSWIVAKRNVDLTLEEVRARRIWHKGAVLTWGPMLTDIIINACNLKTNDEREKLLYRPTLTKDQLDRVETFLERLFNHTLWVSPDNDIDSLLVSARKQDELFNKHFLTINYILTGNV